MVLLNIRAVAGVGLLTAAVIAAVQMLLLSGSSEPKAPALAAEEATPADSRSSIISPTAAAPAVLRVSIELPERLASRANDELATLAGEMGTGVRASTAAQDSDIVVALANTNDGADAVVERWVAVASMWSLREGMDLSGDSATPLLLPLEHKAELEALLTLHLLAQAEWAPLREIGTALAADPLLVSVLPLDDALEQSGLKRLMLEPAGAAWLDQGVTVTWADTRWAEHGRRLAELLNVEPPQITTLVFTGDIIPARCVYQRQRDLGDYTAAFQSVAPYLSSADLTVGSLDASLSDAGTPYICEPTFNLLAPSRSIEGLELAGFDVLTAATNHIRDCGRPDFGCGDRALRDTLRHLREAGIEVVGAGETIAEARRPVVIERGSVRFAFLGYDEVASSYLGATESLSGTAPLTEAGLREDIAAAREQADVVIVLPQWGVEYTPTPTDRQLALGRAAVEAGATLVVGNHPHVVQGTETLAGSFIAYALGNFVFDQDWSIETQQGAVLEATFVGARLLSTSLKPVRIVEGFRPTFVYGEEASAILDRMRLSSQALSLR